MSRLRAQHGFSLVEVMAAWAILTFAIVSTLQVFMGAQNGTRKAQERAAMVVVAQKEIERLRGLPFANLGLSADPPPVAAEGPRGGAAAAEALVKPGVVDPGPVPFASEGVRGRIYRYVTWRGKDCPLLHKSIGQQLDARAGVTGAARAEVAIGDLCPGAQDTKRLQVVVVIDEVADGTPPAPLRAQTVVSDHGATIAAVKAATEALRVNSPVPGATPTPGPQQQLYANTTEQTLHLYDTRCTEAARAAQSGVSHPTHDTAEKDAGCSGSNAPDLMAPAPPPAEPARDYSDDLLRSPADGRALKRDSEAVPCSESAPYTPAEQATRKWSLHRWSTRPLTAEAQTLAAGGRATLTLFTHTVGGAAGAGRLCVMVRRSSTGAVLGSADFRLAQWPRQTTQIAVSFDLAAATLAAGERLTVLVRNHPDSANDLELLYDRADAASSLTLTMVKGKELR